MYPVSFTSVAWGEGSYTLTELHNEEREVLAKGGVTPGDDRGDVTPVERSY